MAQSLSHRLGQIIGDILELVVRKPLLEACLRHQLYLDSKHPRPARGGLNKVSWTDRQGNIHDLDYVIEAGGSETHLGVPKAFIEIAWRRYTKHSRNKAQEIQGAILPLAETYHESHPFLGVVLAGQFTENSLTQLRSNQFHVLYFPYQSVVDAFSSVKVNVSFDEETSDQDVAQKVAQAAALSSSKKSKIAESLRSRHADDLLLFTNALDVSLSRSILSVRILTLFGTPQTLPDAASAIQFLESSSQEPAQLPFAKYEICVQYSNGDEIRGQFNSKSSAIGFLNSFL